MAAARSPAEAEYSAERLARRNGRLYLSGLAASLIGNSAMSLVAGIWVKSLTGSSAAAGYVSVCIYAPSLAGPVGGVVADRVRRRRFLLALNVVSAVMVLPLLSVSGRDWVWVIFVVMAWYGVDLMLSGPAESGLFVEMLPTGLRQRLNGWNLGLQETGRLVAPLVGAGLFAVVGGGGVALLDAATFAFAAVMIWRIRLHETRPIPPPSHWRDDVLAGFAHIRRSAELRRLVAASAVVIGISGIGVAAQYSLVQALGEPPGFLGVLSAGLGAGSVVASLTSSRLLGRLGEGWLAVIGTTNFALGNFLRASGWLPAALAGSVLLGFALPWVFLAVLNLAQRLTPPPLQGRVSAAVFLAVFGPQAPLQALGSMAIGYTSYRIIYFVSGALALISVAWLARSLVGRRHPVRGIPRA
jgi:Transmembrane secretion effector